MAAEVAEVEDLGEAETVGSEEEEVVAVEGEEVDGQVGEVEDMVMVVMTSLTLWLSQVTRWDFDVWYPRRTACLFGVNLLRAKPLVMI